MAHPNNTWLLDPVIPAAPALPRLGSEAYELSELPETELEAVAVAPYPSGTWRVGSHLEETRDDADGERFATSDSEAPTVRPGSLHAQRR